MWQPKAYKTLVAECDARVEEIAPSKTVSVALRLALKFTRQGTSEARNAQGKAAEDLFRRLWTGVALFMYLKNSPKLARLSVSASGQGRAADGRVSEAKRRRNKGESAGKRWCGRGREAEALPCPCEWSMEGNNQTVSQLEIRN